MTNFSFLKSVRFWKLFIVGGLLGLQSQGFIDDKVLNTIAVLLEILLSGSVTIRTIDRFGERLSLPSS